MALSAALCVAGLCGSAAAPGTSRATAPARPASSGSWGKALEVPGTASLNVGGEAHLISVSCGSAGNCSGGGYYRDRSGHFQTFVVSEKNGRWGKAIEAPGSAKLNAGGSAQVLSVSCASAGNCAVGGFYEDRSPLVQAFVGNEKNGSWGKAIEVPGSGVLNVNGEAQVSSVSCGSAGNCSGGGFYRDNTSHLQAFVVSETNDRWGKAIEAPGTMKLNVDGFAQLISVSCKSAGNCSAGGYYRDGSGAQQAYVISQKKGTWSEAVEVPGSGALNKGGSAEVSTVSCASAGNCAAGGFYTDSSGHLQVFVASQKNGVWGKAIEVPGTGALNVDRRAAFESLSCATAGNCSGGGYYADRLNHQQAFVVAEKNGHWGKAIEVPGTGTLDTGGMAQVNSVSCASPGNCASGGFYTDGSGHPQAFVVNQTNGSWSKAIEVPGSAKLNAGGSAQVLSVSCTSARNCAAGGFYRDRLFSDQGFVASKT